MAAMFNTFQIREFPFSTTKSEFFMFYLHVTFLMWDFSVWCQNVLKHLFILCLKLRVHFHLTNPSSRFTQYLHNHFTMSLFSHLGVHSHLKNPSSKFRLTLHTLFTSLSAFSFNILNNPYLTFRLTLHTHFALLLFSHL